MAGQKLRWLLGSVNMGRESLVIRSGIQGHQKADEIAVVVYSGKFLRVSETDMIVEAVTAAEVAAEVAAAAVAEVDIQ